MVLEENETNVILDYAENEVKFFTTRRGERNDLLKRLGEKNIIEEIEQTNNGDTTWKIRFSLDHARKASSIAKVVNPKKK